MINVVSDIICSEYEQYRGQSNKLMVVDFTTSINWDEEEGYRGFSILLWSQSNYIKFIKRTWEDVKSVNSKKDYKYKETWKLESYHDSCWRDAVRKILSENRDKHPVGTSIDGWHLIIDLSNRPEIKDILKKMDYEGCCNKSNNKINTIDFKKNIL
jgi:hypothetical protein